MHCKSQKIREVQSIYSTNHFQSSTLINTISRNDTVLKASRRIAINPNLKLTAQYFYSHSTHFLVFHTPTKQFCAEKLIQERLRRSVHEPLFIHSWFTRTLHRVCNNIIYVFTIHSAFIEPKTTTKNRIEKFTKAIKIIWQEITTRCVFHENKKVSHLRREQKIQSHGCKLERKLELMNKKKAKVVK